MQKLNIGDKVKIVAKVEYEENWDNSWVSPEMDDLIGSVFTVKEICDAGVYFEELNRPSDYSVVDFGFPSLSLEKV